LNPSTASAYRQAFKRRRCLIPADGFFEWKRVRFGDGR
jgi:putative SOS response-associated peptidase YedK